MKTTKFTYWQEGDYYLGFLNDYPDYRTQGLSKEELVKNLRDLLVDLESGEIPYVRKVEELVEFRIPETLRAFPLSRLQSAEFEKHKLCACIVPIDEREHTPMGGEVSGRPFRAEARRQVRSLPAVVFVPNRAKGRVRISGHRNSARHTTTCRFLTGGHGGWEHEESSSGDAGGDCFCSAGSGKEIKAVRSHCE